MQKKSTEEKTTHQEQATVMPKSSKNKDETPGQLLSSARRKAKLTPKSVAKRLFIRQQIIEDIEKDMFDESVSHTFWRGYIRAYGKLVDIDESALTAACNRQFGTPETSELSERKPLNRLKVQYRKKPTSAALKIGLPLLVLLTVISACAYFWRDLLNDFSFEALRTNKPATQENKSLDLPQSNHSKDDTLLDQNNPMHQHIVTKMSLPQKQHFQYAEPIAVIKNETIATTDTLDNTSRLAFNVTRDIWVKVYDLQNNMLFAGKLPAGSSRIVKGSNAFRVFINHVDGVEIALNGEPIALERYKGRHDVEIDIP